MEETVKPHYYKQLDALRFFSVLAVMIGHWVAWDTEQFFVSTLHWGNGVIFFFVLSGFLITEILLNQKNEIDAGTKTFGASIKNFYVRRTLRIFPIYYLLIFSLYYINYKNTRSIFPWLATYTTNIFEAEKSIPIGDFSHFWSLAVEEQFYIFWPFVIFLIPKKHLLKFIAATFFLSLASHAWYSIFYFKAWMLGAYLTHNIMFTLSMGAWLAYIKKYRQNLFLKISNSMLATPLMAGIYLALYYFVVYKMYFPALQFLFDELVFALLACVVIARCVGNGYKYLGKWILENGFLKHLGQISYGLYIYHMFANPLLYEHFPEYKPNRKKVAWIVFFLMTWVAAEVSYFVIERPVSRLKKYFKY